MAFKDMREFLALLEKEGQLKHIDVPLNGRRDTNELQALMNYVCAKDGPALLLNNVDAKHDDGYSYYNSYNEYYGARREAPARIETAAPQLARPRPASREDY